MSPLAVACFPIDGKVVSSTAIAGRLVRLAASTATLPCAASSAAATSWAIASITSCRSNDELTTSVVRVSSARWRRTHQQPAPRSPDAERTAVWRHRCPRLSIRKHSISP